MMIPQVQQIAARIRELRDILELDAEKVAEQIGESVEVYLRYESGEEDIPISRLYAIANVLGVDPTVLLDGETPRMIDYTVVRGGRGLEVERYAGYKFASLAYNFIGRDMEPMIVTLDPKIVKPELVSHGGQEFNYVLSGRVAVILREHEHILEAGDSIYFNPKIPHGQRAVGDEIARFITIINE